MTSPFLCEYVTTFFIFTSVSEVFQETVLDNLDVYTNRTLGRKGSDLGMGPLVKVYVGSSDLFFR